MKKTEKFLNSNLYPLLVALIGFIAWVVPDNFLWLNNALILTLVVVVVLLLSFFKNTKYIIPILLSLLFTINVEGLGIQDIEGISIYHVMVTLALVGLVIHFIRFRHKVKFDFIAFGLLLIAISYIIPMFYMPFSNMLLAISVTGFLYLLFYLFFISTAKVKTDDVLNYFFYASLQLVAILTYSIGINFIKLLLENNLADTISIGLATGWGGKDYGFGNINDLTIHLAILSSGMFYKILKSPKNFLYWIFVILGILLVLLSGSRGGIITLILILFAYFIMLFAYGDRYHIFFVSALVLVSSALMLVYKDVFAIFYQNFVKNGIDDLDGFSSGRIQLYKDAIEVFKQYPIFGAGWTTLEIGNQNRIQVFHSTIFHTLAISGIFGLVSVFVFTVASFVEMFKKLSVNMLTLLVPWTATMLHGLIDNTIHMTIFTVLAIVLFTAVHNEKVTFRTKEKEFTYHLRAN